MKLFSEQQVEMMEYLSSGLPPQSRWRYNPVTDRIDIEGDFNCGWTGFKDFRGIKFGRISGNFDCSGLGLTSLIGAPQYVGKSFNCSKNSLESLEGGPEHVRGHYDCSNNKLVTLKGSPKKLGSYWEKFICSNNLLKDLEGFGDPEFEGFFTCTRNHLTSLEGAPIKLDLDVEDKISYYGNKEVSGKVLELIHNTMIEKKVPFIVALGILKKEIKPSDLKKLIPTDHENIEAVLKGASMLGKFKVF